MPQEKDPLIRVKWAGAVLTSVLVVLLINVTTELVFDGSAGGGHSEGSSSLAVFEELAPATTTTARATTEQALELIAPLLAGADIARGEKVFAKCKACHTVEKGGAQRIGPNLWNVVGAAQAMSDEFNYSRALADAGGAWDFETLNRFLASPRKAVKGTKMSFIGLKKATERADVILYLRAYSDEPVPLPQIDPAPQ